MQLRRFGLLALILALAGCQAPSVPAPKVAASDNAPAYDRKEWRHWIDADHDCQDTRQEVLIAESRVPVTFSDAKRCRVKSGEWLDPYSGKTFTDPADIEIDHMVPLRNAHRSGGSTWGTETKKAYANDLDQPEHLIAVEGRVNGSKSDRSPDEWKPPNEDYWCQYARDWQAIKTRWRLGMTTSEGEAVREMLETCP